MKRKKLVIKNTKLDMLEWVNEAIQCAESDKERIELLVLKTDILESLTTDKKLTI